MHMRETIATLAELAATARDFSVRRDARDGLRQIAEGLAARGQPMHRWVTDLGGWEH